MGGPTTTTQENELPQWYQEAAIDQINLGKEAMQIGHVPQSLGNFQAAFAPQQIAGMQGTNDLARAFGMPGVDNVMSGMPNPQDMGGGYMGYSAFPMYEQSLQNYAQAYPAQAQFLSQFSMDPITGAGYNNPYADQQQPVAPEQGGDFDDEDDFSEGYTEQSFDGPSYADFSESGGYA